MSKILADLTQKPRRARRLGHTVIVRDAGLGDHAPGAPIGAKITGKRCPTGRWNDLHMPEKVATKPPVPELRASGGRRQHQPARNVQRFYTPQDQRNVQTVFVVIDRHAHDGRGQVLARVRGCAAHCEIEAEKLVRSQGGTMADVKVVFEGELHHV